MKRIAGNSLEFMYQSEAWKCKRNGLKTYEIGQSAAELLEQQKVQRLSHMGVGASVPKHFKLEIVMI